MDFYSVMLHYFYYQAPPKKKLASFSHFEEKLIIIKYTKKGSILGFFFPHCRALSLKIKSTVLTLAAHMLKKRKKEIKKSFRR